MDTRRATLKVGPAVEGEGAGQGTSLVAGPGGGSSVWKLDMICGAGILTLSPMEGQGLAACLLSVCMPACP